MKKRIFTTFLMFIILSSVSNLFLFSAPTEDTKVQAETIEVSLIELIKKPQLYDRKIVRVKGIIAIQFENTALYLSKKQYKDVDTQGAIWLVLNSEKLKLSWKEVREFDGQSVTVEGILDKEDRGNWQAYSASIVVDRIIAGSE